MWHWLEIALIFLIFQDYTQSLRLVEVRIPNYVVKGSSAQLECLYDLDGESLYSVKWYKDGNEFYRYVPRDMPPAQTFLLPGVAVEIHNSSDAIVTLHNVNLQSAGRFRCEVSGEAPSFQTVTEHGDMVVVSLPDQGPPKITGGRPRYQVGDWVRVNCTVGRSKPAVDLSWFVNGEPVEPRTLRKYPSVISGREGLETSILGLQFRVEQHHFRNSDMKLKCVASLSTLYWRSNEESVEGDRPQKAPVLESRETVYASNSRADPVQGMSLREIFVTKILSFFIQPNAASKTDSHLVAHAPSLLLLLLVATAVASGCLEQLHMWQQLFTKQPTLRLHDNCMQQQQQQQKRKDIENCAEQQNEQVTTQQERHEQQQRKTEKQLMQWQQQQQQLVKRIVAGEINQLMSTEYQAIIPLFQSQRQQQQQQHSQHWQQQPAENQVCRQHWHVNENNEGVARKCKSAYELEFVNLCAEMLPALTAMTTTSAAATYATFAAAHCDADAVDSADVVTAVAAALPIKRLLAVR
ncbi:uncharacterized protein LOC126753249 isoform X1 [Bactrocera neohumeralis]|uniref:uncharacterized protein LOC126753249 isoform X1 n=1 Tax=Bactrocera neohumeralis TaxID=98809 RepID=UPI002165623A|nr:uncharacterized protein LOC126753249 isoform X1 [Bactrocera neohumeralis]XP_050320470.1 uncharacterized protein LOC126753249 isoform X1 [Bactrocera neohumeralis]XP_050320471.1 uncharacterized protein LOC126753249 isoform X1 [Bactrocera neohumeralis]XP_050320472.1 uncharacterized protein LOC126753249 isoform X1 [Bactrocera neohumeralis]XP_050320473.1 uncharacterized protein LOC126753249 isoform X1 [Bactrocera neohumeralis]